jgi:hypothetical protein
MYRHCDNDRVRAAADQLDREIRQLLRPGWIVEPRIEVRILGVTKRLAARLLGRPWKDRPRFEQRTGCSVLQRTVERDRAAADVEAAERELLRAEGAQRAFGGSSGAVKGKAAALAKAEAAAATQSATAVLEAAIAEVDTRISAHRREHYQELLADVADGYEAARAEADDALARLTAALGEMRAASAAAITLTGEVGDRERNAAVRSPGTLEDLIVKGAPPMFGHQVAEPARVPAGPSGIPVCHSGLLGVLGSGA